MHKFVYQDVPGLGKVVISRHAQANMDIQGISDADLQVVLYKGRSLRETDKIEWRTLNGIRIIVLLNPEPNRGSKLAKTIFRVEEQRRI